MAKGMPRVMGHSPPAQQPPIKVRTWNDPGKPTGQPWHTCPAVICRTNYICISTTSLIRRSALVEPVPTRYPPAVFFIVGCYSLTKTKVPMQNLEYPTRVPCAWKIGEGIVKRFGNWSRLREASRHFFDWLMVLVIMFVLISFFILSLNSISLDGRLLFSMVETLLYNIGYILLYLFPNNLKYIFLSLLFLRHFPINSPLTAHVRNCPIFQPPITMTIVTIIN